VQRVEDPSATAAHALPIARRNRRDDAPAVDARTVEGAALRELEDDLVDVSIGHRLASHPTSRGRLASRAGRLRTGLADVDLLGEDDAVLGVVASV
jgi:hypothetical protein